MAKLSDWLYFTNRYGQRLASEQNGGRMFSPKSYEVENDSEASENSGRTKDMKMHITYLGAPDSSGLPVGANLVKLKITLPPLTDSELKYVKRMVQGRDYYLHYRDPQHGMSCKHFYTSKSSQSLLSAVLYNGLWQNVTFNAIDMGEGLII